MILLILQVPLIKAPELFILQLSSMLLNSIHRLDRLCEIIPPLLFAMNESDFSNQPSETQWSKKQILGHLIDSATNNHQRFVRVQFEENPVISYDQNQWNLHSHYSSMEAGELIRFWQNYNQHLSLLIKRIPEEKHERVCIVGQNKKVTLLFLITDYIEHMEHHLKQIVDY